MTYTTLVETQDAIGALEQAVPDLRSWYANPPRSMTELERDALSLHGHLVAVRDAEIVRLAMQAAKPELVTAGDTNE
jgi:hypothetical protein